MSGTPPLWDCVVGRSSVCADLPGPVDLLRDLKTVTITQHRRPRYVLMTVEDFERLGQRADPRRVYGAGEAPAELAEMILEAIDARLGPAGNGDKDA